MGDKTQTFDLSAVTVTVGGQPAVGYYVTVFDERGQNGNQGAQVAQGITDSNGVANFGTVTIAASHHAEMVVSALDQPAVYVGPPLTTVTA